MLGNAYSVLYTDGVFGFVAQTTDRNKVAGIVAQIAANPRQEVLQILTSDRSVRPQVDTEWTEDEIAGLV